jgi:hypothetical protein
LTLKVTFKELETVTPLYNETWLWERPDTARIQAMKDAIEKKEALVKELQEHSDYCAARQKSCKDYSSFCVWFCIGGGLGSVISGPFGLVGAGGGAGAKISSDSAENWADLKSQCDALVPKLQAAIKADQAALDKAISSGQLNKLVPTYFLGWGDAESFRTGQNKTVRIPVDRNRLDEAGYIEDLIKSQTPSSRRSLLFVDDGIKLDVKLP